MKRRSLLLATTLATVSPLSILSAQTTRGGTLNFGIASGDVTVGVDPHVIQGDRTEWVLSQIAEGLVGRDAPGNPVPLLAQSWTISEDGRTYVFKLRPEVSFHNGRKLTSADVAFTIKRILDPKTASFQREQMTIVEAVETPDPLTVVMKLKQPFSPFITYLSGMTATIIAPECVDPDGNVTKPIGTGPFRFVDWQRNGPVTLERFAQYWQPGLPVLDKLVFRPLADEATRLTALRTGQVDIINSVPPQLLPRLMQNKQRGFELDVRPGNTWVMAIMNTRRPPFDDVRVRQAVSLAVDRPEMMLARTSGLGRIAPDTWPQGSFWDVGGEAPKRDLKRAKALLAEAGHPNGLSFSLEVRDVFLDDAQVLQQQLKDAGIRADLKVVDWIPLRARMLSNSYDMVISSAGSYSDPDGRYGRFYTAKGAANYFAGGYQNPEVDDLVLKGRELTDPALRKPIYRKISEIVQRDVPHTILYFSPFSMAWSNRVRDLRIGADGYLAITGGGLAAVSVSPA
jgi:peptide/nickel transport system substrate-binding protein